MNNRAIDANIYQCLEKSLQQLRARMMSQSQPPSLNRASSQQSSGVNSSHLVPPEEFVY